MRAFLARAAMLLIPAAAGFGCGGGDPPIDPGSSELTTVQVTPDEATLFTVDPGTSVELSALAKDQEAVATVADDGTVTAAGAGSTVITASMTSGDITRSGTATITVVDAPAAAAVVAPAFLFEPPVVDVSAGGTVTWTIGAITHDVVFQTPDAPENIPPSHGVSVPRTFPTSGAFSYRCTLHSGMNGSVRVH